MKRRQTKNSNIQRQRKSPVKILTIRRQNVKGNIKTSYKKATSNKNEKATNKVNMRGNIQKAT